MATLTYATGFEHGTALVAGVGNGLAIALDSAANCFVEAGAARSGGFGLRMTNAAGRAQIINPNSATHVGVFYWRATAKPSAATSDIWTIELPTFFCQFRYNQSTNKIEAGLNESTFTAAAITVTTNQWYRIDFRINATGTTHTLDWMIDSVSQTQVTRGSATAGELATRSEPTCNGANACTWNFDDIATSNTLADYPIGPIQIEGLTADQAAAAAHQGITTTQWDTATASFATFANFTGATETVSRALLNDLDSVDGIRVNAASPAGNARWPIKDPTFTSALGAPLGVSLITATREASAGTNNCTLRTLVGASTTAHFASADPGWGTTWNYLRSIMALKPGGTAWTFADVQGINFEMASSDGAPAIWLSGFFYEVVWQNYLVKSGFAKEGV